MGTSGPLIVVWVLLVGNVVIAVVNWRLQARIRRTLDELEAVRADIRAQAAIAKGHGNRIDRGAER